MASSFVLRTKELDFAEGQKGRQPPTSLHVDGCSLSLSVDVADLDF